MLCTELHSIVHLDIIHSKTVRVLIRRMGQGSAKYMWSKLLLNPFAQSQLLRPADRIFSFVPFTRTQVERLWFRCLTQVCAIDQNPL